MEELYASSDQDTAAAGDHPLGWVPVADADLAASVKKCVKDEAVAVESHLPLEMFDSPEQELISPEDRLAGAAGEL